MTDLSHGPVFEPDLGFSVGNVTEQGFALFRRHIGTFLILLLISYVPELLLDWADSAVKADTVAGKLTVSPGEGAALGIAVFVLAIVYLVLNVVSQAAITLVAFQSLEGAPVALGASLRTGIGRFWPIVGLVILEVIGIALGAALLVLPGIFLLTIWYAAIPACVIERLGPIQSLRRSMFLSKGYRWKLFGILLLVFITFALAGSVIYGIAGAIGNAMVTTAITSFAQAVAYVLGTIFSAVIFRDLRVIKEGHDTDRVAGVFS